jgi:hypothetical protein
MILTKSIRRGFGLRSTESQVASTVYVWNQSPLPGPQPFVEPELMTITGLPGITGVWLDDITSTSAVGVYLGRLDEDVTITMGPVTKNDSEFVSFSQPVEEGKSVRCQRFVCGCRVHQIRP